MSNAARCRWAFACWITAGLLASSGCGAADVGVHIHGQVSYDGEPVEQGTIEFTPVEGTRGSSTGGPIAAGRYSVPAVQGAVPGGTYQVRITGLRSIGEPQPNLDDPQGEPVVQYENYIPARYNSETELQVTIPGDSESKSLDFQLTASAP